MKKIKSLIINIGKKHHWIVKISRKMKHIFLRIKYMWFYITNKIDNKLIVFEVFDGRKYCDSPKALYLELLNNNKYYNYKFVWAFKDIKDYKFLLKNRNTKIVKSGSNEYYKYFAKSKYWIVNYRLSDIFLKKKNQIYVQCWHGTPLKRLGCDINVEGNLLSTKNEIHEQYRNDSRRYNYMISPSKFCTEKLMSAFDIKDKNIMIEKGYPRNDFIVNHTKKDVERIKKELKIPSNKKIILYAPTFRDNQHDSNTGYTYKTELDFDNLKKKLEKDYVILFRVHYLVASKFNFDKYKGFIYNVSDLDDVNELYIISDLLITDYSSVFFDYSILKRPMIFYMYDLDEYKNNLRDFYFGLEELPGPIIKDEKQLLKEIKKTEHFIYTTKYKKFNNKFTYLDDGKSSKRVLEEIIK